MENDTAVATDSGVNPVLSTSSDIHPAQLNNEAKPANITTGPAVRFPSVKINRHYDGGLHYSKRRPYRNPTYHDVGATGPFEDVSLSQHRDVQRRITWRPSDLLRYISPTNGRPRRIMIQAANDARRQPQGPWRRVRVTGSAPSIVQLSTWVLGGLSPSQNGRNAGVMAIALLRLLLSFPVLSLHPSS